jgi:hypothetical protein
MKDTNRQYIDFLAACNYFAAALAFLFGCFPIFHVLFGVGIFLGALQESFNGAAFPGLLGSLMALFFLFMGTLMVLSFWAYGYGMMKSAQYLKRRERYVFCMVMAAVSCILFPIGTALGVFTIILLLQEDVKVDFGVLESGTGGEAPPGE